MENTETSHNKVATSVRIEQVVHTAITKLADEDDRPSIANMMERLLKTHPRVQPLLETENATTPA